MCASSSLEQDGKYNIEPFPPRNGVTISLGHILRTWTFWIHTDLRDECSTHLEATKLQEMRAAPGNKRVTAIFRDRNDGTTVVVVMSVWDSMESIRDFSGVNHEQPSIDPADLKKLFDRDQKVGHYSMSDVNVRELLPPEWHKDIDQ